MLHILFVCTGNTCRSPLAEGLLRMMLHREQLEAEVRSAGVAARHGGSISRNSSALLKNSGFHDTIHSTSLSRGEVEWADLMLTMTVSHKRDVIQQFPNAVEKTFTLKEFVEDDPNVLAAMEEREHLAADMQVKAALSQTITTEERTRIVHLENQIPDYDISDPYGGPMEVYQRTASEIEQSLRKLLTKLRDGSIRA